jgi:hypothetical protein
MNVAMIGICASVLERESKGATNSNGTTIKRLPVVTGYRGGTDETFFHITVVPTLIVNFAGLKPKLPLQSLMIVKI